MTRLAEMINGTNSKLMRFWRQERRTTMDWNRVEGNWKQIKGKAKEKWGLLTDTDLNVIEGRRDQLEGKIQDRYGYAKDKARREVDEWRRNR
jgi:uncharacterized protein YjbJ (UPF0337 family)